jgi:hypothetical protein
MVKRNTHDYTPKQGITPDLPAAETIKTAIGNMPLMLVGGVRTLEEIDALFSCAIDITLKTRSND